MEAEHSTVLPCFLFCTASLPNPQSVQEGSRLHPMYAPGQEKESFHIERNVSFSMKTKGGAENKKTRKWQSSIEK